MMLQWRAYMLCVLQDFTVPEAVEGDSEEAIQTMSLLEDMRMEWQQRKMLEHHVHHAPPELFGVETVDIICVCTFPLWILVYSLSQVYDRLEEYMNEEGPVPPLLLTGQPGLGKSALLAKWWELRSKCKILDVHACRVFNLIIVDIAIPLTRCRFILCIHLLCPWHFGKTLAWLQTFDVRSSRAVPVQAFSL